MLTGSFINKPRTLINGTGFVIAPLTVALWCFIHGNNYEEGTLLATNLVNGADTTVAIYGQLAGVLTLKYM